VINPVTQKLLKMLGRQITVARAVTKNSKYAVLTLFAGQAETETYREKATT